MTISSGSKSVDTKKSHTICCMSEANVSFSILPSQGRVILHHPTPTPPRTTHALTNDTTEYAEFSAGL